MREEASIDLSDMYKRLDDLEKGTLTLSNKERSALLTMIQRQQHTLQP